MSEYEVQEIKDRAIKNGKLIYKIKWKGYDSDECTWEPQYNLSSCKEMLNKFNANYRKNQTENAPRPRNPPAQKTPSKSNKVFDQPPKSKMKSKPYIERSDDEFREEDQQQSQQQRPRNFKRGATPLQGPLTRKNLKGQNTGDGLASSKLAHKIQNKQDMNEESQAEAEEQIEEETVAPRVGNCKLGDFEETKIKILGMMKGKDGAFYFKVKQNKKTQVLNRDEVLGKDPVALIIFYESNLRVFPSKE